VLAGQARQLLGAVARRTVARGARRNARIPVAAIEDVFAHVGKIDIARLAPAGFLAGEKGCQGRNVVILQVLRHLAHGVAHAPSIAKVPELFLQIIRMLRGQARIDSARALAVGAVAQRAAPGNDVLHVPGHGNRPGGLGRCGNRYGGQRHHQRSLKHFFAFSILRWDQPALAASPPIAPRRIAPETAGFRRRLRRGSDSTLCLCCRSGTKNVCGAHMFAEADMQFFNARNIDPRAQS
jgi:hypothetical protein